MEEATNISGRTVVAMSGGVDSSVAALLLHQQGVECVGVSMQVWDYRKNGGCDSKATCCSPDDFTDARKVAAKIGIPYYVFDFEDHFRKEVIDRFVDTYKRGMTPNPCVDCNNKVKFHDLRERAFRFGCSNVATGHYAKIETKETGLELHRGVDAQKDQSYFLYGTPLNELSRTLFPLADLTKAEVRELATEFGLSTASKPESQDICFVSGELKDFLVKIGVEKKRGFITRSSGEIIGQHDGIQNFTVGQRRGLNLGGEEEPLYVLELDAEQNLVIVGAREELVREDFRIAECNILLSPAERSSLGERLRFTAIAQVRHRHSGVPVEVSFEQGQESARVRFLSESATIAPGQACVLYDPEENSRVLAGGRIVAEKRFDVSVPSDSVINEKPSRNQSALV